MGEDMQLAEQLNQEAVKKFKEEAISAEESSYIESAFFEEAEKITLRDGRTYSILPASLKKARRLMQLMKTVNVDIIILNFVPTGDDEVDKEREDALFEILSMAFVAYPEVDREYIEEYVDVEIAREIIEVLIGLNGIKKS